MINIASTHSHPNLILKSTQIDLSNYNDTELIDNMSEFNKYENVVKAGVGTELQKLYSFLDDNDLFIPGGATSSE